MDVPQDIQLHLINPAGICSAESSAFPTSHTNSERHWPVFLPTSLHSPVWVFFSSSKFLGEMSLTRSPPLSVVELKARRGRVGTASVGLSVLQSLEEGLLRSSHKAGLENCLFSHWIHIRKCFCMGQSLSRKQIHPFPTATQRERSLRGHL